MKTQKGYIFRDERYGSWFVRFYDTNAEGKRVQVCKKLDVPKGTRRKDAEQSAKEKFLDPINRCAVNPQSNVAIAEFVEKVYFLNLIEQGKRASTQKQYRDTWEDHVKRRLGKMTLREFRTVHGEQLLSNIARQTELGRHSLKHVKSFLSGVFKQAKRLGVLDGINPMMDTSVAQTEESEETYAYSLPEIKAMLGVLKEPTTTVVLTAALTGLRKGEIRGLTWEDFDGGTLTVRRSLWNGVENAPKTKRSAPVPVVRQLAEALEAHKLCMGKLAEPILPIFQAGNGKPLNLVRRFIIPSPNRCAVCKKSEGDHKPEAHIFERDNSLPAWHGWHAFRRELATNLHALGVDDKTIQAILRHSNIGLTMNIYVKSVAGSQVAAMDTLSKKFGTYNELATEEEEQGKNLAQTRVLQ